jgi:hypothetical protein
MLGSIFFERNVGNMQSVRPELLASATLGLCQRHSLAELQIKQRVAYVTTGEHCCGAAGKLGRHSISAELLQPAELVSGVICQVAVEPELAALLANFLYSNEGKV